MKIYKCSNCGAKISDKDEFCTHCGTKINKEDLKIDKVIKEKAGDITTDIKNTSIKVSNKTKEVVGTSKDKVKQTMDVNGDGHVDIEDVIIMGLRTKGIKIDRESFLRKEFAKNYNEETISKAIETTPAKANISKEDIDKIANQVIQFERNCVSGISTALSVPGGLGMVATIPADIAQYYGYMLRAMQKLIYLYGFPQIDVNEKKGTFDSETLNTITICLGVMYGVAGASNAIKAMAKALGTGVEKQLMKQALTKGTIYPIVKNVSKWFGVRMTKEIFSGFFKKAIPVIGGVVGGGITYISFKPCCDKLKESLQDTLLSNPDHISTDEEDKLFNNIEENS